MGFFTNAYDLFCISLVTKLLDRIYYTDPTKPNPGSLPPNVAAAVNGVALCGTPSRGSSSSAGSATSSAGRACTA
jgi:MFS transporter, PHS family, inorganic phosphate transporter